MRPGRRTKFCDLALLSTGLEFQGSGFRVYGQGLGFTVVSGV